MNRRRFFLLGASLVGAPTAVSLLAQVAPLAPTAGPGSARGGALLSSLTGAASAAPANAAPANAAPANTAPAAKPPSAAAALARTDLIYLTPIRGDGKESRCQAEVWFVHEGTSIWVVTDASAWRARAIARNLRNARIWVGDVGLWSKSKRRYRSMPNVMARGQRLNDKEQHELALKRFGSKYSGEWLLWGPRFRSGLASGSRVLLQYDIV